MKQVITLNNLQIKAYHGVFPEERILGNNFVVSVKLERENSLSNILKGKLGDTVDYMLVNEIVHEVMSQPEYLLETVVAKIFSDCQENISSLSYLLVSLRKMHPPFGGQCEFAEVAIEESF